MSRTAETSTADTRAGDLGRLDASLVRRASRLLLVGAGALAMLHLLFGDVEAGGVRWFHLDKERNLPTWYSSLVFALTGVAALASFARERRAGIDRSSLLWLPLALAGFAMSLDELTILHENLFWREIRWLSGGFGDAWRYVTQWQLVFAPALVIVALYSLLFFRSRFLHVPRIRRWAVAAIGCWGAALLLEALRETFKQAGPASYELAVVAEELFEVLGGVLLFASVASYAAADEVGRAGAPSSRLFSPAGMRVLAGAVAVVALGATVVGLSVVRLARLEAPVPRLILRAEDDRADAALRVARPGDRRDRGEVWLRELISAGGVPTDALRDHLDRLRGSIFADGATPSDAPLPLAVVIDDDPRLVFATAPDPGAGAGATVVVSAFERGVEQSIDRALSALGEGVDAPPWVKIDVVSRVRPVSGSGALPIDRGLDGLAYTGAIDVAILPEEVLARTIVNSDGEVQLGRLTELLEESMADSVPARNALETATSQPYLFRTASWLLTAEGIESLYRGHRMYEKATADELRASAEAAGAYLKRSVGAEGRFLYSYLPKTGAARDEYNILRHAGAIYSMLELYAVDGDESLLAAARRALEYLLAQVVDCTGGRDDDASVPAACVAEAGEVKLGGNALALLALSEYVSVTGDRAPLETADRLARWIAAVQGADGRFTVHKQIHPSGEVTGFVSGYYPGEAIFALVRYFEVTGESGWLDVAGRAATYLIESRDAGLDPSELPHDHWLLYGLEALHRHRPLARDAEHALAIASAIVAKQNPGDRDPADWRGSYYRPPRSTPTAIRSEGLAAAYRLARRIGRDAAAAAISEAVESGVRFQLQTQFDPVKTAYLGAAGDAARGGFHKSLTDFEVRIDYVQHNLSSLLALLWIREEGTRDGRVAGADS